jgi:hypothetical protein
MRVNKKPLWRNAMDSNKDNESALYGIKLHVDRYADAVSDALRSAGIKVIRSPTCFRVIHTSFRGSLEDLLQEVPKLSHYPVKQYTWWRKIADSIKSD